MKDSTTPPTHYVVLCNCHMYDTTWVIGIRTNRKDAEELMNEVKEPGYTITIDETSNVR